VIAKTLELLGDHIISQVPASRIGTPEDVAGTALYLSSRAGAFVNGELMLFCPTLHSNILISGATIALDGGMTSAMSKL
jgi:NAD(P)-dependent dehydrogenase (short-subunit alcohol dehydrogenase family)